MFNLIQGILRQLVSASLVNSSLKNSCQLHYYLTTIHSDITNQYKKVDQPSIIVTVYGVPITPCRKEIRRFLSEEERGSRDS